MPISVVVRSGPAKKDAREAAALTFDGARIVLGRGLGCEVRLPDPSVSQRHATVRADGPEYTLVDEGSTNGTFVGDVRLAANTPRTLRSGDLVRVGRVWLEIRIDQTPATHDLATATRDLALRLVSDAMRALGDDVSARIEVVEGPDRGRTLSLAEDGRVHVVGRGEDCDLALDDVDASREHVKLVRRAGCVLVRDLGSKNGAWLGEARVLGDRDCPWRPPVMLRLGRNVLALEEPVATALAELESAPDEALPADGAPPPPPPSYAEAREPSIAAIAPVAEPLAAPARPTQSKALRAPGWSSADRAVVLAALGIIALSVAGLYWLLRG